MKIACLGDSCTYGQNVRADQAWPHLLWQMTGHDVRNLGVNGDTTRLALERFHRDVGLFDPDVVVVQFGHNDANEWHERPRVTIGEFRANVGAIVARARDAIVLTAHDAAWPKTADYNARLASYRLPGTHPLDIPVLDDGYGVHPNEAGHQMYADYVVERL